MGGDANLSLVKAATKVVLSYASRPKDARGRPGGLIDLSGSAARPIIIGDLHTCLRNLEDILEFDSNLDAVAKGERLIILVGDAVHDDQVGGMKNMESSLVILEYLFRLMVDYPDRIIYIRGNHDTFDNRVMKGGILQGLEFEKYVFSARGRDFLTETERFFDSLPLFVIGKGYVVAHAGPVRGGVDRESLINAYDNDDLRMQLTWNRVHEFRGTPNNREYGEEDVSLMRERLDLPEDTHFIVGHNPLFNTGDFSGVWLNVLGIKDHHIIIDNALTKAPFITFEDGRLAVRFAAKQRTEAYDYGQR
jgi:hypothetical protein